MKASAVNGCLLSVSSSLLCEDLLVLTFVALVASCVL